MSAAVAGTTLRDSVRPAPTPTLGGRDRLGLYVVVRGGSYGSTARVRVYGQGPLRQDTAKSTQMLGPASRRRRALARSPDRRPATLRPPHGAELFLSSAASIQDREGGRFRVSALRAVMGDGVRPARYWAAVDTEREPRLTTQPNARERCRSWLTSPTPVARCALTVCDSRRGILTRQKRRSARGSRTCATASPPSAARSRVGTRRRRAERGSLHVRASGHALAVTAARRADRSIVTGQRRARTPTRSSGTRRATPSRHEEHARPSRARRSLQAKGAPGCEQPQALQTHGKQQPQEGTVVGPLRLEVSDAGGTRRTPPKPGGPPPVPARRGPWCRWRRPAAFPRGSAETGSAPSPEAVDPSRAAR